MNSMSINVGSPFAQERTANSDFLAAAARARKVNGRRPVVRRTCVVAPRQITLTPCRAENGYAPNNPISIWFTVCYRPFAAVRAATEKRPRDRHEESSTHRCVNGPANSTRRHIFNPIPIIGRTKNALFFFSFLASSSPSLSLRLLRVCRARFATSIAWQRRRIASAFRATSLFFPLSVRPAR